VVVLGKGLLEPVELAAAVLEQQTAMPLMEARTLVEVVVVLVVLTLNLAVAVAVLVLLSLGISQV
jgi:hypothetical protein